MGVRHYIRLLRPLNCLMAAFATAIGYWVSLGSLGYEPRLIIAMLAAFLVCGAGQALNDYFDANIDKRIRPNKPIPSGAIARSHAFTFAILLFAIGDIFAFVVNETAFMIALVFTLLLACYSAFFKKHKYLGNWIVASATAFTLLFGAAITGNYLIALLLALSVLFASVPREIIKDLEDMQADVEKVSLPKVIGKRASVAIAALLYALAVIVALFVFASGIFGNSAYLILVLVSAAVFAYSALLAPKNPSKAQKYSKAGMFVALLAFLAGIF